MHTRQSQVPTSVTTPRAAKTSSSESRGPIPKQEKPELSVGLDELDIDTWAVDPADIYKKLTSQSKGMSSE